jgi:hypothetical protein
MSGPQENVYLDADTRQAVGAVNHHEPLVVEVRHDQFEALFAVCVSSESWETYQ